MTRREKTLTGTSVTFADEINDYIEKEMRKRRIPGLALAVIQDGNIVKRQAFGLANVEFDVPVSTATVFQLFSLTKTFTSVSILALVEDGKLSLNNSVKDILPDLPESCAPVTVRHCLSHTSGLPDAFDEQQGWVLYDRAGLLEMLRSKSGQPPGEKASYNQTGFMLLGMIIKKISGCEFEEFVTKRILHPLGMKNTTFGDALEVVPRRATWYSTLEPTADRRWYVVPTHEPAYSPDRLHKFEMYSHPRSVFTCAGLNSNIIDMTNWELALSSGRVLQSSTLEQIAKPFTLKDGTNAPFCLGWLVDKVHNLHRWMRFNGGIATCHHRFIDDNLSVILLTNLLGAFPDSIAEKIASFYLPFLNVSDG